MSQIRKILNVDKYMRIRFKDKGRDFDGCDCRGLVGLILKNEFGIDIPDVNITCKNISGVDRAIRKNNYWKKVNEPGWPCILLFCTEVPNKITHMGLYIGRNDFIHISESLIWAAINSIFDPYWNMTREGFYVPEN